MNDPRPDALPRPGSAGAWLLACRPKTLPVAAAPVLVGTAIAHASGGVRWGPALAALGGGLLLQVAANLANDVFDHEQGADNEQRLGPTRAVQTGLLSPRSVRLGVGVTLGLALCIGFYLAGVGGWPIVVIGLSSMLSAVAYTAGPYPLGYHGLGELFVLVFFGFVAVLGTSYVQTLSVPLLGWWCALPLGALAAAVLVVNNVRDLATDEAAGKRTLAVRLGRRGAVLEFWGLLAVAYLVPPGLILSGVARLPVALPLVTLPLAVRLGCSVSRERGQSLNRTLARTAQLVLWYALTLAAGIVVGV